MPISTAPHSTPTWRLLALAGLLATLLLGACAVQWENRQASEDFERARRAPGSVYMGWRVFQERCAACHGAAATGSATAPNLLLRVEGMSLRRFVGLVLTRYDWDLPSTAAGSAARDAQIDEVARRQTAPLSMPAWQDEPRVHAHIADLHAYLSARAAGSQGPGRPAP